MSKIVGDAPNSVDKRFAAIPTAYRVKLRSRSYLHGKLLVEDKRPRGESAWTAPRGHAPERPAHSWNLQSDIIIPHTLETSHVSLEVRVVCDACGHKSAPALCHDRAPRAVIRKLAKGWKRRLKTDSYEDLCPRCAGQLRTLQEQTSSHDYNAKTKQVIRDAESGRNLPRFETAREMFEAFDSEEKPRG
jgi:hypothetical protein